MTDLAVPHWGITVTGVREEVLAKLFEAANNTVHQYMQQLIAHYGTDTTAIATTADTALYQIRSGVATALGLLGSTVSAGGVVRVAMQGSASYQHAEADYVTVNVSNVVPTTEGGSADSTTQTETSAPTMADTTNSTDETSTTDTQTVETNDGTTAEETAE